MLLGSWLILVIGHPGLWLGLFSFGGLIVGTSLIAFSVMHDANHGAYFRTRRLHLVGWTADSLLGLSSYAWRVKHNVAHHTYTNVDGYDADVTIRCAWWAEVERGGRFPSVATALSLAEARPSTKEGVAMIRDIRRNGCL